MAIKFSYSIPQFKEAVKFIARNNEHFLGQTDYIRDSILEHMRSMTKKGEWMSGTMGYYLMGDWEDEGIDCDQTVVRFEIYVDPGLGIDRFNDEDYREEEVET